MSSQLGHSELLKLLEAVCEDRLSTDEHQRLEELLNNDPKARRLYREYLHLHGSLYWDTAVGSEEQFDLPQRKIRPRSETTAPLRVSRLAWTTGLVAAMLVISAILLNGEFNISPSNLPVAENIPNQVPSEKPPSGPISIVVFCCDPDGEKESPLG